MKQTKVDCNINIGSLIKAKVKERGIGIEELAKKLNCHTSNIYSLYKRNRICTKLLWKISVILNYNFFTEVYGQYLKNSSFCSKEQRVITIAVTKDQVIVEQNDGILKTFELKNSSEILQGRAV
jgi:transcriptional regulator with XRE-family HTH domain